MKSIKGFFKAFTLLFGITTSFLVEADETNVEEDIEEIVIWNRIWSQSSTIDLLLSKTVSEYGPYRLVKSDDLEQARALWAMEKKRPIKLDIMSMPTNKEREQRLIPIYRQTHFSLLGYRICLIPKGSQPKFNNIHTLKDWIDQGLSIGSGHYWTDTAILEHNGIYVEKPATDKALVLMLLRNRFDCYSRGVDQIKKEMNKYQEQGLSDDIEIEQKLLIRYPTRNIYFVNKENPELAKRLYLGYELAQQDGSWRKLKNTVLHIQQRDLKSLKIDQRTIIELKNPFMSEQSLEIPEPALFSFDSQKPLFSVEQQSND